MKITKSMLGVVLLFVILILAGIWAIGEQACVGQKNEEICGTWLNTDPPKKDVRYSRHAQLCIFTPDATVEIYRYESSPSPLFEGIYTIAEKWTDSEGNIWYKVKAPGKFSGEEVEWYFLARISDSEKTLEFVRHPVDYPKELDPNLRSYRIYYRK